MSAASASSSTRHPDVSSWHTLTRSTAVRWTLAIAGGFTAMALVLFGFIYWETAIHERKAIDATLVNEAQHLGMIPASAVAGAIEAWIAADVHATRYAGMFDAEGRHLAGNLLSSPEHLVDDYVPHAATFVGIDRDQDGDDPEAVRAIAWRLSDGRRVVIGNDLDAVEEMTASILRALGLALIPAIALSLVIGSVLAKRAQSRIASMHQAIAEIMQGHLGERLPVRGTSDNLDRLATGVNRMLDEIENLVEAVRGVGDNIAHDLRTPLTRVRTRLERGREELHTVEALADCMDRAILSVDQALAVVSAVLRIGQIQHHARRAQFGPIDLSSIAQDAFELYEPLAEERGLRLELQAAQPATITGDSDLLLEATGNLLENACKFAPPGSTVALQVLAVDGLFILRVEDHGPGIPLEERERVLRRFYRSEKSRTIEGSGLGLSLVAAVADLHGFSLTIGDAAPGCVVDLICSAHPSRDTRAASHVRRRDGTPLLTQS